ncbi:hypothetical protein PUN28_015504 [Cardiocondyla obscurior]|uniref:Uncharacterized protein n=1 Tax=Cardiocondyla obscurior TaxID=286306 RepID=A0AAW2EYL6_9HYME
MLHCISRWRRNYCRDTVKVEILHSFFERRTVILAAYNPRSANAFRIGGRVVTYPPRIFLHLSTWLVVHSRADRRGYLFPRSHARTLPSRGPGILSSAEFRTVRNSRRHFGSIATIARIKFTIAPTLRFAAIFFKLTTRRIRLNLNSRTVKTPFIANFTTKWKRVKESRKSAQRRINSKLELTISPGLFLRAGREVA